MVDPHRPVLIQSGVFAGVSGTACDTNHPAAYSGCVHLSVVCKWYSVIHPPPTTQLHTVGVCTFQLSVSGTVRYTHHPAAYSGCVHLSVVCKWYSVIHPPPTTHQPAAYSGCVHLLVVCKWYSVIHPPPTSLLHTVGVCTFQLSVSGTV